MSTSSSESAVPKYAVGILHRGWIAKFEVHAAMTRYEAEFAGDDPSDDVVVKLTVATTMDSLETRVFNKPGPAAAGVVALGALAGIHGKTAAQLKSNHNDCITEDAVAEYGEAVAERAELVKDHKAKVKNRGPRCKIVAAFVHTAVENNADAKRVVGAVPMGGSHYLQRLLAKLKELGEPTLGRADQCACSLIPATSGSR